MEYERNKYDSQGIQNSNQTIHLEIKKQNSFRSNEVKVNPARFDNTIAQLQAQLKDKKRQIELMKEQSENQEKIVDELLKMVKDLKNNKEEREMLKQRNLLIKQNQQLSEDILKYKRIDAQSKAQVSKLVKDLEQIIQISNQQLLKASQEDQQLKQRLRQEIAEKERTIESLNAEVKTIARRKDHQALKQEEVLRKRVESLYAESQSGKKAITSLENELKNAKLSSTRQKTAYLLLFLNTEAKNILQFDKDLQSKQQFIMYCYFMQKALISSDILNGQQKVRNFIISAIVNSEKKSITKTRLLFKYDEFHRGFGNYIINYNASLLLLIELKNGRICGGFCPKLESDNEGDNTILFTYLDGGRVFTKLQGARKGCSYSNNSLVFGSNELVLMNNQVKQFRISTNQFGARYFKMKQLDFVDDDSTNVIPFEEMELHAVYF